MEAIAKLNNVPIAPRKMQLVVDQIRGQRVVHALNVLKFTRKSGAPLVEKLLRSAIANWEAKNPEIALDDANLFVKEVFVTPGRTLKRFRPAPQGRAYRIRKRSHHVRLVVESLHSMAIIEEPTATEAAE